MAVTLTTTAGSATANSYISAADALTYFANRLDGERWADEAGDRKAQALLAAMRVLEGLSFIGTRATTEQALEWPRIACRPVERTSPRRTVTGYETLTSAAGLYDQRGRLWSTTAIPQPLKDAQCEVAFAMTLDPSLNDPALIQAVLRTGKLTIDHRMPASTRLRMAYEALSGLLFYGTQLLRA